MHLKKNVCGMSAILSRGDELNDLKKKIYVTKQNKNNIWYSPMAE